MKLSEIRGEAAIVALADMLEPACEIMTDKIVVTAFQNGNKVLAVAAALRNHAKSVLTILAISDGADPATYKPNILTLPAKLLEIFNDPEIVGLFQLQSQEGLSFFGSAMGNTEATEQ